METNTAHRRTLRTLARSDLESLQFEKLRVLVGRLASENEFYRAKFGGVPSIESLDDFKALPATTKQELVAPADEPSAIGRNHTWPAERYARYHQTSGTSGRPMGVMDTADDWRWWIDCWQYVLDAAEIESRDRAMLAFSFGPFIGFWSAFDALAARGVLTLPGGGMGSEARLEMIVRAGATVLLATPTYALRLAEVAQQIGMSLGDSSVKKIIVAGEPGGSLPATCDRIQAAWGAKVYDHAGATEVGAWGYQDAQGRGLRIIESEFFAEFISIETGESAEAGELSHLILTPLGRCGAPVVRYRTGDLVRPVWPDEDNDQFVLLDGGVLGRADDMLIVRGVNVFPSSIEQIVREFEQVDEFRLTAYRQSEMDALRLEVEDGANDPERIAKELEKRLAMKVDVRTVARGSLPRFEAKSRRFIDLREESV